MYYFFTSLNERLFGIYLHYSSRKPWPNLSTLMNYELYRRSSLGLALTDALDELVQNQQLTPNLGLKVMGQFDKVMTESLNNKVKVRANLKVMLKFPNV